jgi:hypothetical protein
VPRRGCGGQDRPTCSRLYQRARKRNSAPGVARPGRPPVGDPCLPDLPTVGSLKLAQGKVSTRMRSGAQELDEHDGLTDLDVLGRGEHSQPIVRRHGAKVPKCHSALRIFELLAIASLEVIERT